MIFSTKNLVKSITDIPDEWIYAFYLELTKPLSGRSMYLKSPFSETDNRPSFALYCKDGKYKFKDFSHGAQGTAVDLVMAKFNLTYSTACAKIINDFVANPDFEVEIVEEKVKFNIECLDYEVRSWNMLDVKYWSAYQIGSDLLYEYNVRPLRSLSVMMYGETYIYRGDYMYGYFNNKGDLCKVYRPKESVLKFIRLQEYIQGSDQIYSDRKLVLIQSSLKDIMALRSLNLRISAVAPEGESAMLDKAFIEGLQSNGHLLATLFDGDKAGVKGMLKYKETYGLPYVYIPNPDENTKDIADIRKNYSKQRALQLIVPKINSLL